MKKALFILFLILLTVKGHGQQNVTEETIWSPRIEISQLQKDESPIHLSDVKIDVKIVGSIAVTTVDMHFYNPNNRILEGQLNFPLGEGQSVSRFALDINGKLREGVVVEKAKGQEIFEDIIRQNIDPGLIEKTQGNNYRTRVYPLPPKGTRRVVIAYEQELKKDKEGYRFHLPVQYGDQPVNFDIRVTAFSSAKKPKVEKTPWGKFSFNHAGDAYTAIYSKKNFSKQGQLVFTVPIPNNETIFVEQGKITGDTYFYANIFPRIQDIPTDMQKISNIDIYWDASSSMSKREIDMEIAFLESYFKTLETVKVDLYRFNLFCNKIKSFNIQNGDISELKKVLLNTQYDGATQYGSLQFKNNRSKADQILLFSDGMSNFGEKEAEPGRTPIITINSQLSADHALLKYIATTTNGTYINLLQQPIDEVISSLQQSKISFLYADYNKDEISDLTPSTPQTISKDDNFTFSGRLKKESARITLHFGINDKILNSKTITIHKSSKENYDNIIERMWAQKKINELDIYYEKNKADIESLAKRFGIVTRNTSLIVLDNVTDYVRYEITPPAELLDEYNHLKAIIDKEKNAAIENEAALLKNRLDEVVRMFDTRKFWWNKDFPKTCKPQPKRSSKITVSVFDVQGTDDASAIDIVELQEHRVIAEEPVEDMAFMIVEHDEIRSTEDIGDDSRSQRNEKSTQAETKRQKQVVTKIQLNKWSPDTPYMTALKEKNNKELYAAYLEMKKDYENTPSFYLEIATLFEERGLDKEALIILSNLAEMETDNYRLLRVLGNRLNQLKYTDYAIDFFEQVLRLRPNEPQSYRDLAHAQAAKGDYEQAIKNMYEIAKKSWSGRFPEIEKIAIEEMNHIIAEAGRKNIKLDLSSIDDRLIYEMPVDIRIVLNWDTDNSDMDLWVTDPCGETCKYSNPGTYIGGLMSRDFTQGYGPEEFMIREAIPGKYIIQANYYGTREQTIIGPTTIYLDIYTYYSSGKEEKQTITLRLSDKKETINIGEIIFEKR